MNDISIRTSDGVNTQRVLSGDYIRPANNKYQLFGLITSWGTAKALFGFALGQFKNKLHILLYSCKMF